MTRLVSSILLLLATQSIVDAYPNHSGSSDRTQQIEKALGSLSNIVHTYNAELDEKVQFKKLGEAIDLLDEYMRDYKGKARDKMLQIRPLCSDAKDTYDESVSPLFDWCVAIGSTIELLTKYINDPNLNDAERNVLASLAHTLMQQGDKKVHDSKSKLDRVMQTVDTLRGHLTETSSLMDGDFGAQGYYGKKRAELEAAYSGRSAGNAVSTIDTSLNSVIDQGLNMFEFIPGLGTVKKVLAPIIRIFTGLFKLIAGFVQRTVGKVMGLARAFAGAGIPESVVQNPDTASYKQQMDAIDVFFRKLKSKMEEAQQIAAGIQTNLREDFRQVSAMARLLSSNNREDLLLSNTRAYEELGRQCKNYAEWHGYKASNRSRRDLERSASVSCGPEQREQIYSYLSTNTNTTKFAAHLANACA